MKLRFSRLRIFALVSFQTTKIIQLNSERLNFKGGYHFYERKAIE